MPQSVVQGKDMGDMYQERLDRILGAVALEPVDRVPVVLEYAGFAAHVTDTPMADFLRDPDLNLTTMLAAWDMVGEGDAINYASFWPYGLCESFLCKVRIPGSIWPMTRCGRWMRPS